MNSKVMDQSVEQSMKKQRIAYRISALIATLVFLISVYICLVPGMYPKDQLKLFAFTAAVLIASLVVGSWGVRKAPLARWPLDPLIGVVLLFQLAECLFGVFKVVPLAFR